MGEENESKMTLRQNQKVLVNDENGNPLITIRRVEKGAMHITLHFAGNAFTLFGRKGTKSIYISPNKECE